VICIDLPSNESDGIIIGSLLFELQNAAVNSKIQQLNELVKQRKITKENYIESMEYLEYINSLNASRMAEIGIKMGALPKDSKLPTYSSFKEHLSAQKMSGHSACFARNYEQCLF